MSPEAIANNSYSTQSDVWSFGIVVWEILVILFPNHPLISFRQEKLLITISIWLQQLIKLQMKDFILPFLQKPQNELDNFWKAVGNFPPLNAPHSLRSVSKFNC